MAALLTREMGKVDRRKQVHFCGMVRDDAGNTAVFLPHGAQKTTYHARLTMSALARYGNDASDRSFDLDGEAGNSGALSVILRLAEDFRQNGVFSERQRVLSQNSGKPDWKRTVTKELAFHLEGTGDIYTDIATSRTVASNETMLAQVQSLVLAEIIDHHGWWIDGLQSRHADLRGIQVPKEKRSQLPAILNNLLPRLYSRRAIFLATYLRYYLQEDRGSSGGNLVFGVEDFHSVWETMLRKTLVNVEASWNERLPKAVYTSGKHQAADAPERGMLTDIVLRKGTELTVVDAKYYRATSGNTVPGWPDIAKQMFYELAVRSVVPKGTTVQNCFAFPSGMRGGGTFEKVVMMPRKAGGTVAGFPEIYCHYLDVGEIMQAYVNNRSDVVLPDNINR